MFSRTKFEDTRETQYNWSDDDNANFCTSSNSCASVEGPSLSSFDVSKKNMMENGSTLIGIWVPLSRKIPRMYMDVVQYVETCDTCIF